MGRDVYSHPPRRAPSGPAALTRRSLLGLRPTELARQHIDYEVITGRVRAAWERQGSDEHLRALEPVADAIAALAGVGHGARVADVGSGDGNVALACVARGAEVVACDLAPRMVERGRSRCGPQVRWEVADAQSLPFADASFDAVLSAFGSTLAPRPERVARELCRIVRPGGLVVLAAWIPRGLPGALFELAQEMDPLPNGVPTPAEWGRQQLARERLGPMLEGLQLRTRTVRLRYADPESAFAALSPWAAMDAAKLPALRPLFDRALAACNNSLEAVEIDARYLIASGRRPS